MVRREAGGGGTGPLTARLPRRRACPLTWANLACCARKGRGRSCRDHPPATHGGWVWLLCRDSLTWGTSGLVVGRAPSPPSDYGPVSRRDPAHELKASPWRSNSSNPPKPAGEKSTHRIWSPWSEPAPHSATANSTSTTTSTPEEAFAQVPEGMSFGGQHGSQRDRRVRVPIGTLTLWILRFVGGDRQAGSRMPSDGR